MNSLTLARIKDEEEMINMEEDGNLFDDEELMDKSQKIIDEDGDVSILIEHFYDNN